MKSSNRFFALSIVSAALLACGSSVASNDTSVDASADSATDATQPPDAVPTDAVAADSIAADSGRVMCNGTLCLDTEECCAPTGRCVSRACGACCMFFDVVRIDTPVDTASEVSAADVRSDAAACTGRETMVPNPGVCDGRGRLQCSTWATVNAGTLGAAFATCIQGALSTCARADACTNAFDPATCTCGGGPACAVNQVCVQRAGASAPTCVCLP